MPNDTFKWDDDLVLEFVRFTKENAPIFQGRYTDMEQFKQSKIKERITVGLFTMSNGFTAHTSTPITEKQFHSLKKAIEQVLNDEQPKEKRGADFYVDVIGKIKDNPFENYQPLSGELITKEECERREREAFEEARAEVACTYLFEDYDDYKTQSTIN